MKNRIFPCVLASTIVLGLATLLHAETYNWNGSTTGGLGGVSNVWDTTTANWTGAGTTWPSSSTGNDNADFGGTAGIVTLNTGVTANEITFSSGNYTIGADNTAGTITLDGVDPTITSTGGTFNTIGAIIQGSGGLIKAGPITVQLRGVNTYSGDTRVLDGILLIGQSNNRLPTTTNLILGDAVTNTSGVFQMNSRSQQVGGLETAGTGTGNRVINSNAIASTFTVSNAADHVFGGILGGATANDNNFAFTKSGVGGLTLTNSNTFTGNVTVTAGRLTLEHSNALGLANPDPPFNGRKGLIMQGTGRSLGLIGDITIPENLDFFVSSLSFDGGGIENVSGNNEVKAQIHFTTGNAALNISSASDTLTISGNITMTASDRTLRLGGASEEDNTISGNITESTAAIMPVIKQGDGKWILSGTNTYKGDTTINGGTLVLANGGSARFLPKADASSNMITGNGSGTLTLDGALDIDLTDAASAPDNTSWLLVDVDNVDETYGPNFTVTGFAESPAGTWNRTVSPSLYTFTESDGRLVKTAATASPFEDWMSTNFPDITAPDNAPGADPDGDGVNNLAEFAFAGDPGDGSNNGLIRFGIEDVGGTDYLTYTFACRSGATFTGSAPANASVDGVDYSVRASLDLSDFTLDVTEVIPAITTGLPAVPSGYTYRTFRVTDPQSTHPKAFIQVMTSPTAP